MPTTTRYLDPPTGLTSIAGETSRLRNVIAQRKRIDPADLDDIRELYQIWIQHTHSYYDLVYSAFANTPPRGSEAHTRVSSNPIGAPSDPTAIEAGLAAYRQFSTEVFELISNFNDYVHQHYHEVQDEIG